MFPDNARAALMVKRDDAEEDDIDDAFDIIARIIKAEVCETEYDKNIYTREISKSVAAESESVVATPQAFLFTQRRFINIPAYSCVGPSHNSSSNRSGCADATKKDHPAHV